MVGTLPRHAWALSGRSTRVPAMSGRCIAANADGKSCADPYGRPECTPTAANRSGWVLPNITAMAAADTTHVDAIRTKAISLPGNGRPFLGFAARSRKSTALGSNFL